MHPILFRLPLPKYPVPLFWVLLAAGGVALGITLWQLAVKQKPAALTAGAIAAVAAFAAFHFKGQTWEMAPVPIYSYGVMLGLSLIVGWYLTLGLAERDGLPRETMANCYVATAFVALAGSRVLYILTNWSSFQNPETGGIDWAAMVELRGGGLVAYGGFLGGLLGSYLFLRKHDLPLLPWADVAVPSLASGLMITRIGCYLFGCDFGKPLCDAPGFPACNAANAAPAWLQKLGSFPRWAEGLTDHRGSPAVIQHEASRGLDPTAAHSFPVHPTQIYESLVGAGLLVLLLTARKRQKFRGQIFLLFAFSYGVCRFLLEILRDDEERGFFPGSLALHILIPLCLTLFAIGYVVGFSKMIKHPTVRLVTQIGAFLPAVALYVALKPASFGASELAELSTSQVVALATGLAAAVTFGVFYQSAEAHPESAMLIKLPASKKEAATSSEPEDEEEENEEDDVPARVQTKSGRVPKRAPEPKQRKPEPPSPDSDAEVVPKEG